MKADAIPLVESLRWEACPQPEGATDFVHDPTLPIDHECCYLHTLAANEINRLSLMVIDLGGDPGATYVTTDIANVVIGGFDEA
jgi:hypothetical protein